MPRILGRRISEEDKDIIKKRAVGISIIKRVLEENLEIDEDYRNSHIGQFILVCYESTKVYPTEEEADTQLAMLPYEAQKRVFKFGMGGGGLRRGYALVTNPKVKWFKNPSKMQDYLATLPQEMQKTAIHWLHEEGLYQ